ncbi:MAG: NADH-quinone oxidoreductase subunit NuoE [Dethiobacter sp.]|jgi:NADH-quinone oxidoreductase subunit E|nr:NADH-quinone oxidoreductase subunit NuoE [Dethiobacter sp.]
MCKSDAGINDVFARFKGKREELIPILQAVQNVRGYLPADSMKQIARFVSMPESQVYGVATFFAQFYFSRRGKHQVKVCYGTACHVKGATRVLEAFERELGIACGCTSEDYEYSLERVACVGSCALAPVVVVDEEAYGQVDPGKVANIVKK